MKKAEHQVFIMALAFTLLSLPGLAFALDGKYELETLRGIKALHVIIKGFESEIEQYGLTREMIQNELETKLGLAGIKVLSREECLKEQGSPFLTLMVGTLRAFTTRDTEFYFFSIVIFQILIRKIDLGATIFCKIMDLQKKIDISFLKFF